MKEGSKPRLGPPKSKVTDPEYSVTIYTGADPIDLHDDNLDVEVQLHDGRRFGATFFTLKNIRRLMSGWETTGECASGLYFWCSDPIIVRDLSRDSIERCIADLLEAGEFEDAFVALED